MTDGADKASTEQEGRGYLTKVIIVLSMIALTAIVSRLIIMADDRWPEGDISMKVSLHTTIRVIEPRASIHISPPWDTGHVRLFGQTSSHPGLKLKRASAKKPTRDLVFTAEETGDYLIDVQFDLQRRAIASPLSYKQPSEKSLKRWLEIDSEFADSKQTRATLIDVVRDKPDADELIDRLFRFVSQNIRLDARAADDARMVMDHRRASASGMHDVLLKLLRAAHLPARHVSGFDLSVVGEQKPVLWVEVYVDERWRSLDVVNGYADGVPETYVPFRRGGTDIVSITDDRAWLNQAEWRVENISTSHGRYFGDVGNPLAIFDLTRLPPSTRSVLGLLMLLPITVLFTEALRQLLGLRTYGTFTPSLLALAAAFVDWFTAAVVFVLVIGIGIAGRSLLPSLNLSRVPRLSVIFVMIALSMTFVVSALIYRDPSTEAVVVLLPTVILTTLVDRIYTDAEKYGTRIALRRIVWTAIAALISLLVLLQADWGETLLSYPELHLLTLAAIILLGRLRGWCKANLDWFGSIQLDTNKDDR